MTNPPEPIQDDSWNLKNNQHPVWPIILVLSVIVTFLLAYMVGSYAFPHIPASVSEDRYDVGYSEGYFDALEPVKKCDSYSVWPSIITIHITESHEGLIAPRQIAVINHYYDTHKFTMKAVNMPPYFIEREGAKPADLAWVSVLPTIYTIEGLSRGAMHFFIMENDVPVGDWYFGLNISRTDDPQSSISLDYKVIVIISRH